MKKYKVILFQKYIRSFVTNFFKHLNSFEFTLEHKEESTAQLYKRLNDFNNEINRVKTTPLLKLRRILGIPNVRIKFSGKGDFLFTYGCLVFGNKPYCIYSETGLSIYNYDRAIADNPIARTIASFLIRRKKLKKIIFLSEAAQKSFLSSVKYSSRTKKIFERKSVYCYPLMEAQDYSIKKYSGGLKLLFIGTFYIKGGNELVTAFRRLKEIHRNIHLTIITSLGVMRQSDVKKIKEIEGIQLFDAKFTKDELDKLYKTHDIFIMPTYRDGFGLVWIEALSHAMPIIGTNQFATGEFCINSHNGFMYPNHPLQDYNNETFEIYGKYYNPKDFYTALFKLQKEGKMRPVEDFLCDSIERFIRNPGLLEEFSKNSAGLYNKKFHPDVISERIESIFLEAMEK
ncbi:MAG: hypothetical protein A2259_00610 [Candidatus Moranbacteria bacterium RIFOXYA2_FULL_43_15]|nr:MAG: hypothetical protein A2259_00610 [Candidatus Moranbacteria bacterium RIFOXYA2_FULL_43_15]